MASHQPILEVNVWTDPTYAPAVKAVLDLMGDAVKLVGVGGPGGGSEIADLAKALECNQADDLRKLLVEHPTAFFLLGCGTQIDCEDLQTALQNGTVVLSLEPLVGELDQWALVSSAVDSPQASSTWGNSIADLVLSVPAFLECPGFLQAAAPHELLGEQPMIGFLSYGPPDGGSLFARLYDAWRTVLEFTELPQAIDAQLSGPLTEVPDQLRKLTGRLSAHARLGKGGSVSIAVTDHAAEHHRMLHVLGDRGQLRVGDGGYELWHADGPTVDRGGKMDARLSYVELIATQWRRLLDRPSLAPLPAGLRNSEADALACCLTCLLSARTGQAESPERIVQMQG